MAQLDYVLQAMNVYVDGVGKLGWVEKLTTPKISKKTDKFRGGGMLADRVRQFGYEAFEFDFSLNAFDPQTIRQAGLFSKNAVTVSFTAALDGDNNAQHSANFITRSVFTAADPGGWEAGKKAMLQAKGACAALKLTMDGAVIYDIDIDADKYIIDGVDEYAWIKAAL
jgi:P2 family phage contractile tail tube protein